MTKIRRMKKDAIISAMLESYDEFELILAKALSHAEEREFLRLRNENILIWLKYSNAARNTLRQRRACNGMFPDI